MNTDERSEVVLDTNVLVAAALGDGPPYEILSLVEEGAIVSVTSPAIVDEFEAVLVRDRLPFTDPQVDRLVSKFVSISRIVDRSATMTVVADDPDDDKILETAVSADVDRIVSGDSHLLDLADWEKIAVVRPAPFLEQVRNE